MASCHSFPQQHSVIVMHAFRWIKKIHKSKVQPRVFSTYKIAILIKKNIEKGLGKKKFHSKFQIINFEMWYVADPEATASFTNGIKSSISITYYD